MPKYLFSVLLALGSLPNLGLSAPGTGVLVATNGSKINYEIDVKYTRIDELTHRVDHTLVFSDSTTYKYTFETFHSPDRSSFVYRIGGVDVGHATCIWEQMISCTKKAVIDDESLNLPIPTTPLVYPLTLTETVIVDRNSDLIYRFGVIQGSRGELLRWQDKVFD